MVFKPKVHLFITLSYSKQNNESAPLGIGNMQKLGLKGNISYIVFVNVMIFCLINKCSFIKFSFLCTKWIVFTPRDLQTMTRSHTDSEPEGGCKGNFTSLRK